MTTKTTEFASEIDLDKISSEDGVIHEVGGGPPPPPSPPPQAPPASKTDDDDDDDEKERTSVWEEHKLKGNDAFRAKDYERAYDHYTDAIDACPSDLKAEEILRRKDEHDEARREEIRRRNARESERRRRPPDAPVASSASRGKDGDDGDGEEEKDPPAPPFELALAERQHPRAGDLSVYHSNRATASYYLGRHDDCVRDCTVSILLNPRYVKPLLRRSAAHEALAEESEEEHASLDDALRDARAALALEPGNVAARKRVQRLERAENERMEKLKTETMGKLKDLGNSILGNFGLSLDNFEAKQDPNTGSYSISFNQNK